MAKLRRLNASTLFKCMVVPTMLPLRNLPQTRIAMGCLLRLAVLVHCSSAVHHRWAR